MTIVVAALVIFGGIIYLLITVLAYMGQASSLSVQVQDLENAIAFKKQRLEDYQIRADRLKDEVPDIQKKADRMSRWIVLLTQQKAQLQAEAKKESDRTGTRDAAIRRNLFQGKSRKG